MTPKLIPTTEYIPRSAYKRDVTTMNWLTANVIYFFKSRKRGKNGDKGGDEEGGDNDI